MPFRETTHQNQGQTRDEANFLKNRHQFKKALTKSTFQLLETNKLELKYTWKWNNNTRHENWTHNFLLDFLKSDTASKRILSFSLSTHTPLPPTKFKQNWIVQRAMFVELFFFFFLIKFIFCAQAKRLNDLL